MSQHTLLDNLEIEIRTLLEQIRAEFPADNPSALTRRPFPGRWNALECFAHLNAYSDYYMPLIEKAIHKAKARRWQGGGEAESSWLGRWSMRAVDPNRAETHPRKSPKRFNFLEKNVSPTALKALIINLEMFLRLLRLAREIDLNKAKVEHIRWSFLTIRLGDLLQYMVLHSKRHVGQAKRSVL